MTFRFAYMLVVVAAVRMTGSGKVGTEDGLRESDSESQMEGKDKVKHVRAWKMAPSRLFSTRLFSTPQRSYPTIAKSMNELKKEGWTRDIDGDWMKNRGYGNAGPETRRAMTSGEKASLDRQAAAAEKVAAAKAKAAEAAEAEREKRKKAAYDRGYAAWKGDDVYRNVHRDQKLKRREAIQNRENYYESGNGLTIRSPRYVPSYDTLAKRGGYMG